MYREIVLKHWFTSWSNKMSSVGSVFVKTVLPGDDVTAHIYGDVDGDGAAPTPQKKRRRRIPKIGNGLMIVENHEASHEKDSPTLFNIVSKAAGRLVHRESSQTFHVLQNRKRYEPKLGDRVIGVVEERFGEYYQLNVFGTQAAYLHRLEFEGATKRNMPNLAVGALVYGRISLADCDMEPHISCKVAGDGMADGGAARKDWMTGEATYGELKDSAKDNAGNQNSTCMRVSLGLARELIHPQNVVMQTLGNKVHSTEMPFEVCIGANGVAWVNSTCPEHTIVICNAIKNSEVMTPDQTRAMVKALMKRAAGS
jgi:exosome complex component RRP40